MFERNLYKVLQVDPAAEPDVIAAAHRALAAKLHPERDISGVAEYRMRELNEALAVLRDPERRRAYDERLRNDSQVPVGPGSHAVGTLTGRVQGHDAQGPAEMRIDFGRYAGWTLGELVRADPDYLRWLSRHSSGVRYRGAILRLLAAYEANRTPLRT